MKLRGRDEHAMACIIASGFAARYNPPLNPAYAKLIADASADVVIAMRDRSETRQEEAAREIAEDEAARVKARERAEAPT